MPHLEEMNLKKSIGQIPNKAFFCTLCCYIFIVGCAHVADIKPSSLDLDHSSQVIDVVNHPRFPTRAIVTVWQKQANDWQVQYRFPAVLGRRGLAPASLKKEGDGYTPQGHFTLTQSFGYLPHVQTGLNYQQVTEDDFWVDDVSSAQYNQWVKGEVSAKSFERLKRNDHLYRYAIVIDYNRNPIVPGAGSAIFMHIWRNYHSATAGCVAVSERNMRRLLKFLNSNQHPIIIIRKT